MSDITPTTFSKPKPHPLLASLPAYLKDHRNYDKIQKALLDAGATKHSHSEVIDWAGCFECQRAEWNRKEMMQQLGFRTAAHYMAWKKVHETIKERVPFPKYNS